MGGNGKFLKLKVSLFRSSHSRTRNQPPPTPPVPPPEYICPVCETLITEPVVVGSGHTFDRTCVQVCQDLGFVPNLPDGSNPDFSAVIPNLALQTAIPNWCDENGVALPKRKVYAEVADKVKGLIGESNGNGNGNGNGLIRPSERFLIDEVMKDKANPDDSHAITELTRKMNRFDSTSSDESVIAAASPLTPLPFTTRPACWSPYRNSSSSEFQTSGEFSNPNPSGFDDGDDEEFLAKFKSSDPYDQEQGANSLRKVTRNDESARVRLCTARLLVAVRPLLVSSYEKVQVNAVAAVVNLSLEKENKVKIVRSGIVPTVVDLLKGRLSEIQEHAAGAIFSLSLEEKNRTAIGVLGALPPLMHCLIRSDSERTRSDSALALYNLSLDHSNRVKLVKLGAVPPLLAVLRSANEAIAGRVLLVLYQLAASSEGKAAMLDSNAVEHLVALLRRGASASESTRENCVAALYSLSHGSMRFKALARDARAVEVLKEVEETGSERAKDKARRILVALKGRRESEVEENDEVDWEAILESAGLSRSRPRVAPGPGCVGKTTEF